MPSFAASKPARLVFDYYVERDFSFQIATGTAFARPSGRIPAMPSNDANSGGGDREVFGSLPRSRPQRRSAKRGNAARAPTAAQAETAAATSPEAAARAPRARAAPRAKAAARPRATGKPPAAKVPPAGYATPEDDVPSGVGLVTTAVQAAGELAVIGVAAGGRAVKSVIQRLPRP